MEGPLTNARLIERTDVTPDLCIVRIRPDLGSLPPFEPGQFATLGLPGDGAAEPHSDEHWSAKLADHDPRTPAMTGPAMVESHVGAGRRLIRRAYSIASSPSNHDHIELLLALVKGGHFTPRFWPLRAGDAIWLDPHIRGRFTLAAVPPEADVVMAATGTGIAPFMSMLRSYRDARRWRRLAILHGARCAADLAYRGELASLAAGAADIVYLPTVTREPADSTWTGARGRVTAMLEPRAFAQRIGWVLDPARTHVLLCGNPQMIDDAEAMLLPAGFSCKGGGANPNLHFERYW